MRKVIATIVALVLATLALGLSATGSWEARADEPPSSSSPPPGHEATPPTSFEGGSTVLIIEDVRPWTCWADEDALDELGKTWHRINCNQVGNIDLTQYGIVLIPSDQTTSYYNCLIANRTLLADYVSGGGVLIAHATDQGWNGGSWTSPFLPGDVGHVTSFQENLSIVTPTSPIVAGKPGGGPVSDAELDDWNHSTHGYFTNLPGGTNIIIGITGAPTGQPTYIEYPWGSGHVLATMQTLEWIWPGCGGAGQPNAVAGRNVLRNEILHAQQKVVEADLKVTSVWMDPWPTEIDVSETFTATINGTVHNNGPYGPATGTVTFSADAPPDCTADVYLCATQYTLPVSVATTVGCNVDIHCSQASSHTFDFDVQISEPKEPHVVDLDPTNNIAWTSETVTAIGYADLKPTGISVTGPAEIDVSETGTATVHLTLHNNGGYGPVTVTAPDFNVVPPADCTAEPSLCARQVELPVSLPVTVDCDVYVHCSKPSSHTFQFEGWVGEPKEPHVVDPNPANNGPIGTSWTVTAIGYSDMKVVAQYIANPPAEIAVSQDVLVVLEKVIHNNGTWGPVEAFTETVVTAPANCTVHPEVHIQQYHNLPVSVDILHHEPFTIHCYELGEYTFVFDDEVGLKEPHVRDLMSGNNTSSNTLILASVAVADVKITGIGFVNPPTKIPMGQDVDITLRQHMHNNGPWDPVDIAIDATAAAPTDCTVTAKSVPTSLSSVPVSVDQVVDEVWTVNCTDDWPPLKTFGFDNSIDVATPYVSDPDQANNSSHKWLTVRDPFYPYWGDDTCDGQDNDGDTVIDEDWDLSGSAVADCLDPALDTDGDGLTNDADEDDDDDGWSDDDEGFMRTDPLNACPLDAYHDAWPPDINNDEVINVLDIMHYRAPIHGVYDRRYDLNADGVVNVLDLMAYRSVLGMSCSP